MEDRMRQTKIKQKVDIIDGNQLIGKVVEENDPFVDTCIDVINELPEYENIEKVMMLKKKIESGDYDFDQNLDVVVDALITESKDENSISYPLFDR
jgi:anti-sigma28 factor (negative regulator of flagellin synthesis)